MRVHSEGLGGTQFIPVNVFEVELPLMLFSPPLRSKSIVELSRPARHMRGTSLTVTHKAPGQERGRRRAAGDPGERQSACLAADSNMPDVTGS